MRQLAGQHGRATETGRGLDISVKIHVLNCCCSIILSWMLPSGSLPVWSPTCSWVLNMNYYTPVKNTTTLPSE